MESPNTTCSVCFFSYDGKDRRPLVLPCSHSFCQECLQQLDRDGNKLCPCCRESWQRLKITDLTFCRQLIPEQGNVQTSSSGMALCEHHNVCLTLWCDACQCLLCVKCITVNHSECELRLFKDKRADLVNKFADILKDLTVRNINKSDILILNKDLEKHKKIPWQEEIKEKLKMLEESDTKLLIEESAKKCEQTMKKIKTDQNSATLLKLVTEAYAATRDGTPESFISHFLANQNSLAKLQATAALDKSDSKQVDSQWKEGQEWTLNCCKDLFSVKNILTNTSVRPSAINMKFYDSKDMYNSQQLVLILSLTKCEKRLALLDCFWTPYGNSRETTSLVVDELNKNKWRSPVELWGHLDAAAVKLLPITVQRVGLVLASADDMGAVNALQSAVVKQTLQRMDLSILMTFETKSWDLQWNFSSKIAGFEILQHRNTRLALHFPNVRWSQVVWMISIIDTITSGQKYIEYVRWLYLPGTTLKPDDVLGIVRDTGVSEVHLPPRLTAEQDRKKVEKQYKELDCTIVWDV